MERPWEALEELVEAGDRAALGAFLAGLEPGESTWAVSRLAPAQQAALLELLPNAEAAEIVDQLPDAQTTQIFEQLPADAAAAIVSELPSDEQADLLAQLSDEDASAILDEMTVADADRARKLSQYDSESAGGLMITEHLVYREDQRVEHVLDDLRRHAGRYRSYDVQYAYVLSRDDRLVGVLPLRDLVLSSGATPIRQIMKTPPLRVLVQAPLDELRIFFDHHTLFGVPVTDDEGRMLGVVRRQDVEEAIGEQASRTFLQFAGILGGEELRTMPFRIRCARRLSWLSINIVLNILAASVIAWYQDTLAAVIALAVFLPIISDMSGCSGNQSVAVSIRELSLGLIRPNEMWRVIGKEVVVGLINGLVLGLLLVVVAFLWKGSWMLGVVVGTALALNTLFAVCFGGLIPLVLQRFKQDPALASSPILTTLTDMCGFFLILSLARLAMPWLIGI